MVEQITSTNIKKYIGYLASPKIPEDMHFSEEEMIQIGEIMGAEWVEI